MTSKSYFSYNKVWQLVVYGGNEKLGTGICQFTAVFIHFPLNCLLLVCIHSHTNIDRHTLDFVLVYDFSLSHLLPGHLTCLLFVHTKMFTKANFYLFNVTFSILKTLTYWGNSDKGLTLEIPSINAKYTSHRNHHFNNDTLFLVKVLVEGILE